MKYIGLFSLFLLVVGCGNEDSKGEVGRYQFHNERIVILDTKTGRVFSYNTIDGEDYFVLVQEYDLNTEFEKLPVRKR